MYLVNVSEDPRIVSRKLADLKPLFDLAKLCRATLMEITGVKDPVTAFGEAQSDNTILCELEVYVEAIRELAVGIDRGFNRRYQLTASKAEQVYQGTKAFIRSLEDQLRTLSQTHSNTPPQVGSRTSIWTVSGGLPTLGRKRP